MNMHTAAGHERIDEPAILVSLDRPPGGIRVALFNLIASLRSRESARDDQCLHRIAVHNGEALLLGDRRGEAALQNDRLGIIGAAGTGLRPNDDEPCDESDSCHLRTPR